MIALVRAWLTRSHWTDNGCAPPEVPWLRGMGLLIIAGYVVSAAVTAPRFGLSGRGLAVLLGTLAFVALALWLLPMQLVSTRRRTVGLLILSALAAGMLALQPEGLWVVTPYIVGSVAAMRLPQREAWAVFVFAALAILATAALVGKADAAWSVGVGVVPWFLFMRLMRRQREEYEVTKGLLRELEASRTAEAQAAAEAERSRLAREMHDVLAHSLSSLALQLESTRMLAADRDTDPEVAQAVERAHGLAAAGLEEARQAIGALRGEQLPGPERLPALIETFREHSGMDCALAISGEPRPLAPDAQLALYRTAQEALTNVRRHADARRVELRLAYGAGGAALTVADHGHDGAPPLNGHGGYGLAGMRERAELLGGRLHAGPTDDGFRVDLWLPSAS